MATLKVDQTHRLKTVPSMFNAVLVGTKMAEFRKDDRGFQVGDLLHLCEWDPTAMRFTGREVVRVVSHMVEGPAYGIPLGYVMLSMVRT